jgi:Transposase DDE domain group 1
LCQTPKIGIFWYPAMPKGLRTLRFSFTDSHLTHFGGMVLIQRFCNQLRLRHRLQRYVPIAHRGGDFLPSDLILVLLYSLIAGLRRINHTEILQYNGTFLSLLGLERFPDQTTLRRFLQRLPTGAIRSLVRLHDQLRRELFVLPAAPTTLIFDLDSVVLTLYGQQQGARIGYNPKKKGRRSYHPLLCFEAHRQEFWHGSLRPGDTAANTGVVSFLQRCLAKVPGEIARSRIRVRADSGFFSGKLVRFLDQTGLGYVIVARLYPAFRRRACAVRFHQLSWGIEVGEFRYKPLRWKEAHRFVVVRRPIPEDPGEAAQLTLFKDRRYAYTVLLTNLDLEPWRVWTFYRPRAIIEKDIRELLYDLPLGKIPSADWVANVAFFQTVLLAFNLVHWFKRLCLPQAWAKATVETVRGDFLVLPAKMVRSAQGNVLQLPKDYHYEKEFLAAARAVEALRLSRKKRICK